LKAASGELGCELPALDGGPNPPAAAAASTSAPISLKLLCLLCVGRRGMRGRADRSREPLSSTQITPWGRGVGSKRGEGSRERECVWA